MDQDDKGRRRFWRRRPDGAAGEEAPPTMGELRLRIGSARSDDDRLEDLYWRSLAEHASPGELGEALLLRLEPRGRRLLLDVATRHRRQLRERLVRSVVGSGTRRGELTEHKEQAWTQIMLLPELAFAHQGRWAAAALYGLEHDRLAGADGRLVAFLRAALRYKMASVLEPAPGEGALPEASLELARGGLEALGTCDRADGAAEVPRETVRRLSFHLHEWLGSRALDGGRIAEAIRCLEQAIEVAPEPELEAIARAHLGEARRRSER